MKSLGIYNHKNEARDNYWVERYRKDKHCLHLYTPTNASRVRISRLLRKMYRLRFNRFAIFFVSHAGNLDFDAWQNGYDDKIYDGIDTSSEMPCQCDACKVKYIKGMEAAEKEIFEGAS